MRPFFEFIQRYITKLYCFRIVKQYELGIRLWLGCWQKTLQPGLHWVCPVFGEVMTADAKRQIINLPEESICTADGQSMAVSGAVEYQITDPRKAFLEIQDIDNSLQNLALGVIAEYVSTVKVQDEMPSTADLADNITEEIQPIARNWGIVIYRVWITDWVRHRVYRLMTHSKPTVEYEED